MEQILDYLSPMDEHSLSELLPYDPKIKFGARLLSGLKEYLLIICAAQTTIDFIEKKEIGKFDPLVGENACQIRAVKIADTMKNVNLGEIIYHKILTIKKILHELIVLHKKVPNETEESLYDIFKSRNLDLKVNKDFMFLLRSYILSKIKMLLPQTEEDNSLFDNLVIKPRLVQDISDVGIDYAERFVRKLRVDLSESSVSYVQELSRLLPSDELAVRMVSTQYSIRHMGLECIPYYWTTQVLIQYILMRRIPIILSAEQRAIDRSYQTIKKAVLYFEPTPTGYQYQSSKNIARALDEPAIIVCGTSNRHLHEFPNFAEWLQELSAYSITDLILAHAASHRQYPDESKEMMLQDISDSTYRYYKAKAELWGCSMLNPSHFFIMHIFSEKIGKFILPLNDIINQKTPLSSSSLLEEFA